MRPFLEIVAEFPRSDRDCDAFELWATYVFDTEAFDRLFPGYFQHDAWIPLPAYRDRSAQYARLLLASLDDLRRRLGVDDADWRAARPDVGYRSHAQIEQYLRRRLPSPSAAR